jgi:hypothetical protein
MVVDVDDDDDDDDDDDGEQLTVETECPKCGKPGVVTGTKRWRDDNSGRPDAFGKIMQSVQVAPGKKLGHKRLPCADTKCYRNAQEVKYTPKPQLPRREKPKPKPKVEKPPKKRGRMGGK